jgi:hypothetical protein
MITCESRVEIAAPTQMVWGYLADFGNWQQLWKTHFWISSITHEFQLDEPGPAGLNSLIVQTTRDDIFKNASFVNWTIREWRPPQKMALVSNMRQWLVANDQILTVTVVPKTATSCEAYFRLDFIPQSAFLKLIVWLSLGFVKRRLQASMDGIILRLKQSFSA